MLWQIISFCQGCSVRLETAVFHDEQLTSEESLCFSCVTKFKNLNFMAELNNAYPVVSMTSRRVWPRWKIDPDRLTVLILCFSKVNGSEVSSYRVACMYHRINLVCCVIFIWLTEKILNYSRQINNQASTLQFASFNCLITFSKLSQKAI